MYHQSPPTYTSPQAKIISDEFKALSEAERTKWDKIAAEDKERYQREMELKYEFLLEACATARTPLVKYIASALAMVRKRVVAKDLDAMSFLACKYLFGDGVKKDARRAFELWTEAANLGSADAHSSLGNQYRSGDGVEQDDFKAVQHWEKAACWGHVQARHNLGGYEDMLFAGLATKQEYADALRGYQDAVEEMKSPERDVAKKFMALAKRDERGGMY
ncbi:hypothetical protein THAOC_06619 [Thalassiosira oceanica]|uniref:HMG box domain-containing protein n=1 Tax=Thalassiosira oceanica TaxID=159749 RepID=K0T286_THAOC|nr:hypothetical protein THAOC_06619 [Thalassiosira oceanica]|eukprot:EJK71895.1 hypothetical protein THAOC_06619 [Thalassiosira oceanica]